MLMLLAYVQHLLQPMPRRRAISLQLMPRRRAIGIPKTTRVLVLLAWVCVVLSSTAADGSPS